MKLTEKQFIGNEILGAANDFAALRISVFREFPYLYDGTLAYELSYIQVYSQSPNAILFALYHEERMIGATTCVPLEEESNAVKAPFIENALKIDDYLYFGESLLLPEYRGFGYGKKFFQVRESHAIKLGKLKTCFCSVDRPINHPLKPESYTDNTSFWTKQGYEVNQNLKCEMEWLDRMEERETIKKLTFWTKEL